MTIIPHHIMKKRCLALRITSQASCAHRTFTPRKSLALIADGRAQHDKCHVNRFTGLFRLWRVQSSSVVLAAEG